MTNEIEICKDYLESNIGIEALGYKYHVGKKKIKDLLQRNGIEIKKRGAQDLKANCVGDPTKEKYSPTSEKSFVAIDRRNGTEIYDVSMNSVKMTNYIVNTYHIEKPTIHKRKKYYEQSGNYWWEQWMDVYSVSVDGKRVLLTDTSKNIKEVVSREKRGEKEISRHTTKKLTWREVLRRMKESHPNENLEYPEQELTNGVHTKIRVIDHDLKEDGTEYGEYWIEVRSHIAGNGFPNKKRSKKTKLTWNELYKRLVNSHPNENLEYPEQELTNGVHTKIRIIDHDLRDDGTEYGEYYQDAYSHIAGCGHPEKGKERSAKSRRAEWSEFVRRMKAAHPNENLEYPEQELTNGGHTIITIIDHDLDKNGKEYGAYRQEIKSHIKGASHPRKAIKKRSLSNRKRDDKQYIECFKEIFGDKYSYEKFVYYGYNEKSTITCKEHGDFIATPGNLIKGHGCPKCANVYHYTLDEWKEKAKLIHGEKYDYSLIEEYENTDKKLTIICPKHGIFHMSSNKHLVGQGCPQCGVESRTEKARLGVDEFIRRATEAHNGKYTYNKEEIKYENNAQKVPIHCPKHGVFYQQVNSHLRGNGCPKCASLFSRNEEELFSFVKAICPDAIQHERNILNGKEIDIFIPSKNIGIEYNGLYWHSEKQGKGKNYHLWKMEQCNKNGVKLIQIFEDEYLEHKEIVLSKIKHLLGVDTDSVKIGARKCRIAYLTRDSAKDFLDANHIQGFSNGTIYIGAYSKEDNILIGVMSFKEENKNSNKWELTRFATKKGYTTPGLGSKMFKWFVDEVSPDFVKSFADRRWTQDKDNNLYAKIGFVLDKIEGPDYRYIDDYKRKHKFLFRKQILSKRFGLPLTMTETEMCERLGYERIWDCGLLKYVWFKDCQIDSVK